MFINKKIGALRKKLGEFLAKIKKGRSFEEMGGGSFLLPPSRLDSYLGTHFQ